MRLLRFTPYWASVIVWFVLMYVFSTELLSASHTSRFLFPFLRWLNPNFSFTTMERIQLGVRKMAHLTEYAILAGLLWQALRRGTNLRIRVSILQNLVLLLAALFAVSDEFHQSFVATRTASPVDVMIDIAGACIGVVICRAMATRANRQSTIANRK